MPVSVTPLESLDFRKNLRVPIAASAIISWAGSNRVLQSRKVIARDMSAKGMFLYTESPPPLGSLVKLEILLPMLRNAKSMVRIKANGRVVRVQPPNEVEGEEISGFAIITDRFTLQDPEPEEETKQ